MQLTLNAHDISRLLFMLADNPKVGMEEGLWHDAITLFSQLVAAANNTLDMEDVFNASHLRQVEELVELESKFPFVFSVSDVAVSFNVATLYDKD